MRYYLITNFKFGNAIDYPDLGHKDYKNAGYNVDTNKCIWIAQDDVDMQVDKFDNIVEITKKEFDNYIATWKAEKEEQTTDSTA